jgi:hypothetical protein
MLASRKVDKGVGLWLPTCKKIQTSGSSTTCRHMITKANTGEGKVDRFCHGRCCGLVESDALYHSVEQSLHDANAEM